VDSVAEVQQVAGKGLEYLLVIGSLLLIVMIWRFFHPVPISLGQAYAQVTSWSPRNWFKLQEGFYYHPGHTWVARKSPKVVRVGIDDFAQKLLGKPSRVKLPGVGKLVYQGSEILELEVDSKTFRLVSPITGEVTLQNKEVLKNPELINQDPYGDGWLLEVRDPVIRPHLRNLLYGGLATAWMGVTEEALSRQTSMDLGALMQDGGTLANGIARALSPDKWGPLAEDFLLLG
jgi:glycine cleavage system H lipoate-binding protein